LLEPQQSRIMVMIIVEPTKEVILQAMQIPSATPTDHSNIIFILLHPLPDISVESNQSI
jgi:hypothetical protein